MNDKATLNGLGMFSNDVTREKLRETHGEELDWFKKLHNTV